LPACGVCAPFHPLSLGVDDPVGRGPEAPSLPRMPTMRTAPRGLSRALREPLPGGSAGDDRHRALDHAFSLRVGRLHPPLARGKRLGRLHPRLADALAPFGHRVLPHAADQRRHIHGCGLHPGGAGRAVMVRHPRAVIARKASDGARRAPHVLGHVTRQALLLRGDSALLPVGPQAIGILPATRSDPRMDRVGLERLAQPGPQGPLPLATQQVLGQVLPRLPAGSLGLLPSARGEQRQVRVEARAGAPPGAPCP